MPIRRRCCASIEGTPVVSESSHALDNTAAPCCLSGVPAANVGAGGVVAENWKLTGAIADTVRMHHDLDGYAGDYGDVLRTVAVADFFANREGIGFSGNRYPDKLSPEVFRLLAIEKSMLEDLEEPVNAEIEKAKVFLKLGG